MTDQRVSPVTCATQPPGFEVANLIWLAVQERRSVERYRDRVWRERLAGRTQVGVMLDGLCRAIGADPVTVWRIPHAEEQGR